MSCCELREISRSEARLVAGGSIRTRSRPTDEVIVETNAFTLKTVIRRSGSGRLTAHAEITTSLLPCSDKPLVILSISDSS